MRLLKIGWRVSGGLNELLRDETPACVRCPYDTTYQGTAYTGAYCVAGRKKCAMFLELVVVVVAHVSDKVRSNVQNIEFVGTGQTGSKNLTGCGSREGWSVNKRWAIKLLPYWYV